MVSDQFRQQLQQEAEQWQAEGLISEAQYQQLVDRYQFDRLALSARNRFIAVVIGLGSLLLGLGVLTFVAANWQAIPRSVQLLILMLLFIGVNAVGFYLWFYLGQGRSSVLGLESSDLETSESSSLESSGLTSSGLTSSGLTSSSRESLGLESTLEGGQRWQQRLGLGLLLLGALILGANMALVGQMFHINGSLADLYVLWGLGVLLMAYSLRLTALGVVSIVLMGIGYWTGLFRLDGVGIAAELEWLIALLPVVSLGLFIPLAYWCRSRAIFVLAMLASLSSLEVILSRFDSLFDVSRGILYAVAFTLPPAFLWSFHDHALWRRLRRRADGGSDGDPDGELRRSFASLARGLALLFLTVTTYLLSFHRVWSDAANPLTSGFPTAFVASYPLFLNFNILVFFGVTLAQWIDLGRRYFLRQQANQSKRQTDMAMLMFLSATASILFWHWTIGSIQPIATAMFNLFLFLLALGYMREGLAEGQRGLFWSGIILLALQIFSRLLEYETGLLLKSIVFLICGVTVIVIGLWFERYLRTLRSES